jgi:large subunit ribosomal protein L10
MPGRADFHEAPSANRIYQAGRALALLHNAWGSEEVQGLSRGVLQRIKAATSQLERDPLIAMSSRSAHEIPFALGDLLQRTAAILKVILINDDYTPREFVIAVLMMVFHMSEDQAYRVMMTAHQRGACVVAAFTRDIAESKATEGTNAKPINDLLKGPTGIAFSADPISAPKIAVEYAKTNAKFVILGGVVGDKFLDVKGVEALASLPSLDELRARLAGMLKQPQTKIAQILQAPGGAVARVIGAYARKGEAA